MHEPLPETYAEVLDFEKLRWKYAGAKEAAIRDQFAMTSTRYAQVLNAAIDHPAAEAHDVLLVRRLRRQRAARARERSRRRLRLVSRVDVSTELPRTSEYQ